MRRVEFMFLKGPCQVLVNWVVLADMIMLPAVPTDPGGHGVGDDISSPPMTASAVDVQEVQPYYITLTITRESTTQYNTILLGTRTNDPAGASSASTPPPAASATLTAPEASPETPAAFSSFHLGTEATDTTDIPSAPGAAMAAKTAKRRGQESPARK
ncbi:hypothetical protein GQ53DRAFT_761994 [Thozetella sp. PMI_491]|nr:hypothetical protein GQ53DRAFT_761994 [Thozetella sp. PMI_491]